MQGQIQSQNSNKSCVPKGKPTTKITQGIGIGRIILQFVITNRCDLCQSVSISFMFLRSQEGVSLENWALFCTRQFVSFLGLETWPGLTWPLPEGRFRLGTGNRVRARITYGNMESLQCKEQDVYSSHRKPQAFKMQLEPKKTWNTSL